jgi:hypothetical protein
MSKFIFSVVSLSLFGLLYLGVFSTNAEAGNGSIAPAAANCAEVCTSASDPCDGTNTLCLCDTITGEADCLGTDGDDVMCGTDENETFRSGEGDDIICAGGGDDILHGGWGCDDLQGEGDATAGAGDELHGGHCADSHIGGDGDGTDDCYGGWGNDTFNNCDGTVKQGQTDDFKKDRGCVSVICGNVIPTPTPAP